MKSYSDSYKAAGVDVTAGYKSVELMKEHVKRTSIPGVVSGIGGFGGLFQPDMTGMKEPVLVSGTDGVGTKLVAAMLLDKHDTIGIDCVAMCVNDVVCCGAKPLFFLDYIACGKNVPEKIAEIVKGVAEGCVQSGCALIGGEMAEHPGVMDPDDYDLSGFSVAIVDRPKMIGPDRVEEGDVLIGLASSGIHSNGYSLVRKVCVEGKTHYELRLPREELGGESLQEALLRPTRIYVKPVRAALNEIPGGIHALAHITGGGITENLNRALPKNLDAHVELGSWSMPPVIPYVCQAARLGETEALKTFNMGLGMILIVNPERADEVERVLTDAGETTFRVGSVVKGKGSVVYANEGQLFVGNAPKDAE